MRAVADYLPQPTLVLVMSVGVDQIGEFGLNGPTEHFTGSLTADLGEEVMATGQWHDAKVGNRLITDGVLFMPSRHVR